MIERYSRPQMAAIWTDQAQFQAWLDVELAACRAWSELGHIPSEDVDELYNNAGFSIDRILEIEAVTRHDVVAFTRAVSETLGPEKKWIHYGLTSTDVVDTAWGVRLKKANEILAAGIQRMCDVLAAKAIEHKHSVMMGRTHGIHAEPTTFGLKCALWFAEMKRNQKRFVMAAADVEVGKLSGAVGTFANIPPEVEEITCRILGLKAAEISTQTLQRDRHAYYVATLATIASTLEKMAVEVRHLQKSETREAEEYFAAGQKGSSAMPHKRNPISSENITGCARVIRGYMVTAFENVPLWHERDISHSSAERIILPDATILLDYMLHRFARVMEQLVVFTGRMKSNIDLTHGLVFSQRVMLKLIDKGLSREKAYDTVQPLAMQAWEQQTHLKPLVLGSDAVREKLSEEDVEDAFDLGHHMAQVNRIFARVGL
ncbi:MAG: adenylosuccinate lyase [Candidatus Cyclonatronum sp.]|uniref:adenylosuccinate lyase n=1 Tax=Cyclonatronum sp. TaxID=3024185 RepID=UPI0025C2540D|nr:adenylosuccinate lyase [Cyclonatronum sp.]MCH8485297.1 adenylosuccinate lyase [Cyclonatronum sp.]